MNPKVIINIRPTKHILARQQKAWEEFLDMLMEKGGKVVIPAEANKHLNNRAEYWAGRNQSTATDSRVGLWRNESNPPGIESTLTVE